MIYIYFRKKSKYMDSSDNNFNVERFLKLIKAKLAEDGLEVSEEEIRKAFDDFRKRGMRNLFENGHNKSGPTPFRATFYFKAYTDNSTNKPKIELVSLGIHTHITN